MLHYLARLFTPRGQFTTPRIATQKVAMLSKNKIVLSIFHAQKSDCIPVDNRHHRQMMVVSDEAEASI